MYGLDKFIFEFNEFIFDVRGSTNGRYIDEYIFLIIIFISLVLTYALLIFMQRNQALTNKYIAEAFILFFYVVTFIIGAYMQIIISLAFLGAIYIIYTNEKYIKIKEKLDELL
ncbi:hypothetical protein MNB_SM-4-1689 [hydrothermal vent metagenome]|uniref:Uncharacterized protein n=1 Tax=hydrothermal vent metagenome TaxID=652676 RepID=A0A1W1CSG7_9ZZZZ